MFRARVSGADPQLTDDLLAFLEAARDEADRNEQRVVVDAAQDLIDRLTAQENRSEPLTLDASAAARS